MKKNDMRILWNVNDQGQICEYRIVEFKKGKVDEWPIHLNKIFRNDLGNSWYNWSEWELIDIFYEMFWRQEWETLELKDKFLIDLLKVEDLKYESKYK